MCSSASPSALLPPPLIIFFILLFFLHFHPASSDPGLYSEQSLHILFPEESPPGSSVLRLPPPPPGFSPWRLSSSSSSSSSSASSSSSSLFHLSSDHLLTSARLDRESLPLDPDTGQCLLEVLLSSHGVPPSAPSFRLLRIIVEVADLNDNSPRFGTDQLNLSLSESSLPGTRFALGRARDPDAAENGTIGGYELLAEDDADADPESSAAGKFRAEMGPGEMLVLELVAPVDREHAADLRGRIRVRDRGTPPRASTVTLHIRLLDANDNAPQFERAQYEVTVDGNRKMGRVRAADPDEGRNGEVWYRIVAGGRRRGEAGLEVDERTGELTWSGEKVCPVEEGDDARGCTFVVEATDQGQPPLTGKATVTVHFVAGGENASEGTTNGGTAEARRNDTRRPIIRIRNLPSGQPFAVVELGASNGTVLAVVTAEEDEEGREGQGRGGRGGVQLEMEVGGGGGGMFRLEQIRKGIALLRMNKTVEGGGGRSGGWKVEVISRRPDGEEATRETVQVFHRPANDSAPVPLPASQTIRVPEDLPAGSLLARISSSSESGSSPPPLFRLLPVLPRPPSSLPPLFQIHPSAGLLRLRHAFPPLAPGEAVRRIELEVELSRPAPWMATARAQVHLEIYDVNDHPPLITNCPSSPSSSSSSSSSPCVFTVRLPEDHPPNVQLATISAQDPDSGPNALLSFSLRPFGPSSPSASVPLFSIDPLRGNISLRRPLDFELGDWHRVWVRVQDAGTPPRATEALLEVFVEDVNDELPRFPPPAQAFLNLRLSHPARLPLLSIRALDPDLEDRRLGLRYAIVDTDKAPLGMFELNDWDQLVLARSPAERVARPGDQFMLRIGATDRANHSAPTPLQVHIRIVADGSRVPPEGRIKLQVPGEDGKCVAKEQIMRELDISPEDNGRLNSANLSLLASSDPGWLLNTNSSASFLCHRSSASPSSSSHHPLHLLADLGPDGWTLLVGAPSDQPCRAVFADPAPASLTITLPGTPCGHPLYQVRVRMVGNCGSGEDGRRKIELEGVPDDLLGMDPEEGLIWLARTDGWMPDETEMRVRVRSGEAEGGPEAEMRLRVRVQRSAEANERREALFALTPSLFFFFDSDSDDLHPGDLLAHLAHSILPSSSSSSSPSSNSSSSDWPLLFTPLDSSSPSNWSSSLADLIELFPDGELRLLRMPQRGLLSTWEREVRVEDAQSGVNRTILVQVHIQGPSPGTAPLECLHPPPILRLPANAPPGTFLGHLMGDAENNGHLRRFRLKSHWVQLMVDEATGTVRTRNRGEGAEVMIRYEMAEIGGAGPGKIKKECTALIRKEEEGTRKERERQIRMVEISHREAEQRARRGQALADLEESSQKGVVPEGPEQITGRKVERMRDTRGDGAEHFELLDDHLLFFRPPSDNSSSSLLLHHPIYHLTSSSSSSSIPQIHLRLIPPFADHLLHIQISSHPLWPSSSSSSSDFTSIPRNFPLGSSFARLRLHFHPHLDLFLSSSSAPEFSPRLSLIPPHHPDDSSSPSSSSFPFHLCPLTGHLSLLAPLSPESSVYILEVEAEESWTDAKGKRRVEVRVGGEADDEQISTIFSRLHHFTPSTASPPPSVVFWIRENAPAGTILGQLPAAAMFGTDWAKLELIGAEGLPIGWEDARRGVLAVTGPIDAEQTPLLSFRVRPWGQKQRDEWPRWEEDDGSSLRVDVVVMDENEHAPRAADELMAGKRIVVAENSPLGARLVHLGWRDADLTSELSADVLEPNGGEHERTLFWVDAEGWLRVAAGLDRERDAEHRVHIRIRDGSAPRKVIFTTLVLNISVADVNDGAPRFLFSSPSSNDIPFLDFLVDENIPRGTVFGTLSAIDRDLGENGTVRYRLIESEHSDRVALDPLLGYLSVDEPLDRELLPHFELTVEAFDLGTPPHRSRARVRVTVLDADDTRPEPAQERMEMKVAEGSPRGTVLGRVRYSDADQGSNALALFSILDQHPPHPRAQFRLGALSGVLSLSRPLDHSLRSGALLRLNVSLAAFSVRWPPSFISVSIRVLPPPPSAHPPPPIRLSQLVHLAIHPLLPLPFAFNRIILPSHQSNSSSSSPCFSLLPTSSPFFSVHPQLGILSLVRLPPPSSSLPATDDDLPLPVHISSVSSSSSSIILNLLIRLHSSPILPPPLLSSPPVHSINVPENRISAEELWKIETEEDNGRHGRARFRLEEEHCDDEEEDEEEDDGGMRKKEVGQFAVDATEGTVTMRGTLDAERCSRWRVRVRVLDVFDEWNFSANSALNTALLRVRVADIDESEPELHSWAGLADVFMPDTVQLGSIVHLIKAVDRDIHSRAPKLWLGGPDAAFFKLDPNNGALSVAEAWKGEGSRPGKLYSVTVGIRSQQEGAARIIALHLYIAPTARFPVFGQDNPRTVRLPLRPDPCSPLARFRAHIPSSSDNSSSNPVIFSIASGDPRCLFRMDPLSGALFWIHPLPSGSSSFLLHLAASSSSPDSPFSAFWPLRVFFPSASSSSSSSDCVFRSLANHSSPPLSPFLRIKLAEKEMAPEGGTEIAQVGMDEEGEDEEDGKGGREGRREFEMEMNREEEGTLFRMGKDGRVEVIRELDRERDGDRIRMSIWPKDGREEGRRRSGGRIPCLLEVQVLDRNDNAPRFGHILDLSLRESVPPGSVVFRARAEDADTEEHARNWYSLEEEDEEEEEEGGRMFSIDKWTGELRVEGKLDRERKAEYRMQVRVQDGEWRAQSTLTVHVLDENDNAPRIEGTTEDGGQVEFWMETEGEEGEEELIRIGRVDVRDADEGRNAEVNCWMRRKMEAEDEDEMEQEEEEGPGWMWMEPDGVMWANWTLFRMMTERSGTDEGGIRFRVFCADNGLPPLQTSVPVRLRWNASSSSSSVASSSSVPHPSSSHPLRLSVLPASSSALLSTSSLPIIRLPPPDHHHLSDQLEIGQIIVGEEPIEEAAKWRFEMDGPFGGREGEEEWRGLWVDERSGRIWMKEKNDERMMNKGCWAEEALIEIMAIEEKEGGNGRVAQGMFRLLPSSSSLPPPASSLLPRPSSVFLRPLWHFVIPRLSPNGTIIGRVPLHPSSSSSSVSFHLANGPREFQIDPSSGELILRDNRKFVGEEEAEGTGRNRMGKNKNKKRMMLAAEVVVGLIGARGEGEGHAPAERCTVRVFFLDRLPALCPVFPASHFSVQLPSDAPIHTELIRFDFVLTNGSRIALEMNGVEDDDEHADIQFCFPAQSPATLSLCSSFPPLHLLPSSSSASSASSSSASSLILRLTMFCPSADHIHSRAFVSVQIIAASKSVRSSADPPVIAPGAIGFVRPNAAQGQNILQIGRSVRGPFEIAEPRMEKLFNLDSSSGTLSIRHSLLDSNNSSSALPSLLPVPVRSPTGPFVLFVVVEKQRRRNAGNGMKKDGERPKDQNLEGVGVIRVSVLVTKMNDGSGAGGRPEKLLLVPEGANERCEEAEKELGGSGNGSGTVRLLSNCSLVLPPPSLLPSSSSSGSFSLGSTLSLHFDPLDPALVLPRLVPLSMWVTPEAFGTFLGSIQSAVPDLVLLVPILLFTSSSPHSDFASVPFGLHRPLITFRDPNGAFLPPAESISILEHFWAANPNLKANLWDYRVDQDMSHWLCREVKQCGEIGKRCLEGARRIVIRGTDAMWTPFGVEESCLKATRNNVKCSRRKEEGDEDGDQNVAPASSFRFFHPSASSPGFIRIRIRPFADSGPLPHSISIHFSTLHPTALLFLLIPSSSTTNFLSVDLINGKARLNLAWPSLHSCVLAPSVNNGKWWKLTVRWAPDQVIMRLAQCRPGAATECNECTADQCRARIPFPTPLPSPSSPPLISIILGDLSPFPDLFRRPRLASAFSLSGCLGTISINGLDVATDLAILAEQFEQFHVEINATDNATASQCPPISPSAAVCEDGRSRGACAGGICVPDGDSDSSSSACAGCMCTDQGGFEAADCANGSALSSVSLPFSSSASSLPFIRFVPSPWTRLHLSFVPLEGNLVHPLLLPSPSGTDHQSLPRDGAERHGDEDGDDEGRRKQNQRVELDFRYLSGGPQILLCANNGQSGWISVEVDDRSLRYTLHPNQSDSVSSSPSSFQMSVHSPVDLNSGQWHRMSMEVAPDGTRFRLQLDDQEKSAHPPGPGGSFPPLLSAQLNSLSLGGPCPSSSSAGQSAPPFRGCLRRFVFNNQLQPIHPEMALLPAHKRFLDPIDQPSASSVAHCDSSASPLAKFVLLSPALLLLSISVIVLLPLLCLLLIFFIIFRRRRRNRKNCRKEGRKEEEEEVERRNGWDDRGGRTNNVEVGPVPVTTTSTAPPPLAPSHQATKNPSDQKIASGRCSALTASSSSGTFSVGGFSSFSGTPCPDCDENVYHDVIIDHSNVWENAGRRMISSSSAKKNYMNIPPNYHEANVQH